MPRKPHGKKLEAEAKGEKESLDGAEIAIWRLFPSLVWFVESLAEADTTTPRRPGSLTLFHQDGGIKVCLRDRSAARVAFVWAQSVAGALEKAEAAMVAGHLDWRPDKFASGN